jgi:AcrR family transcriptional regulator
VPEQSPLPRKPRTRAILLDRMIAAVASAGYRDTSVEQVLAGTGLARSTFYDHFADKSECFLAALDSVGRRVEAALEELARREGASVGQVIELLVGFAGTDIAAAKVLFVESLAAGPRSVARRDLLLERLDSVITGIWEQEDGADGGLDLPARVIGGGVVRLLAMRLGRAEPQLDRLAADLLAWAESYRHGSPPLRREESAVPAFGSPSPTSVPILDQPLVPLEGRVRRGELVQAQRLRILRALMKCSYEHGYEQVTVADITDTAMVSRKAFYKHFPEKTDAALAADELVFQTGMVAAAAGFFSAGEWPERVWQGGVGLLGFLAANPEAAHFAFVDTAAVGHPASALAYERLGAFAVFLEEAYRIRPQAQRLPRTVTEALMATMYERAYLELRDRRHARGLLETLPHFIYLILAPFIGPEAAGEFVAAKIDEAEAAETSRSPGEAAAGK